MSRIVDEVGLVMKLHSSRDDRFCTWSSCLLSCFGLCLLLSTFCFSFSVLCVLFLFSIFPCSMIYIPFPPFLI